MSYYHPKSIAVLVLLSSLFGQISYACFGILFGELVFLLMKPIDDEWMEDTNFWLLMFMISAIARGFFAFMTKFFSSYVGENLTFNIRVKLFESIMHKSLAWFDRKDRAPGALINILSEDVTKLNALTTETFSLVVEAVACLCLGVAFSFIYSWKIALVGTFLSPLMLIGGYLMFKVHYKGTRF
jgi:ATP-binding cassette subfamily B (MDR/TAP) protein 1